MKGSKASSVSIMVHGPDSIFFALNVPLCSHVVLKFLLSLIIFWLHVRFQGFFGVDYLPG